MCSEDEEYIYQLRHIGPPPSCQKVPDVMRLSFGVTKIGRGQNNDYFLDSLKLKNFISRYHAEVVGRKNENGEVEFVLMDKGLNGTFINDYRTQKSCPLEIGDKITFGHTNGYKIQPGFYASQPESEFQFIFEQVPKSNRTAELSSDNFNREESTEATHDQKKYLERTFLSDKHSNIQSPQITSTKDLQKDSENEENEDINTSAVITKTDTQTKGSSKTSQVKGKKSLDTSQESVSKSVKSVKDTVKKDNSTLAETLPAVDSDDDNDGDDDDSDEEKDDDKYEKAESDNDDEKSESDSESDDSKAESDKDIKTKKEVSKTKKEVAKPKKEVAKPKKEVAKKIVEEDDDVEDNDDDDDEEEEEEEEEESEEDTKPKKPVKKTLTKRSRSSFTKPKPKPKPKARAPKEDVMSFSEESSDDDEPPPKPASRNQRSRKKSGSSNTASTANKGKNLRKRNNSGQKTTSDSKRRKTSSKGKKDSAAADLSDGVEWYEEETCEAADCKRPKNKRTPWVQCDDCDGWYHTVCVGANYRQVKDDNASFSCGCT